MITNNSAIKKNTNPKVDTILRLVFQKLKN